MIDKCPLCGGRVRPTAKRGRVGRHRNVRDLPIPADLEIPTCAKCGEAYVDLATGRALDAALKAAYDERLRAAARTAIASIIASVTQKDLERRLGLAHGYVSKLLAGKKTPSYDLAAHLVLLARSPKRRLEEEAEAMGGVGLSLKAPAGHAEADKLRRKRRGATAAA